MSETQTTSTALMVVPAAQLPTILQAPEAKGIFDALLADLDGYEADISTPKGRAECASKARKVGVAKQDLLRIAEQLKKDALKTQRGINAEERVVTERFDSLRDHIRAPLTEFENAEKARVAKWEAAVTGLEALIADLNTKTPDEIKAIHDTLPTFDWPVDFQARGTRTLERVVSTLKMAHQAARQRQADEAEAERKRQEQAEAERLAAEEAQRQREARIAEEAKEKAEAAAAAQARIDEQRRQREAQEAEERHKREAERQQAAIARLERDKHEAEERRVAAEKRETEALAQYARDKAENEKRIAEQAREAERKRAAAEAARQQAEADKLAANQKHAATVHAKIVTGIKRAISGVHTGNSDEATLIAKGIIVAIAKKEIDYLSIDYSKGTLV